MDKDSPPYSSWQPLAELGPGNEKNPLHSSWKTAHVAALVRGMGATLSDSNYDIETVQLIVHQSCKDILSGVKAVRKGSALKTFKKSHDAKSLAAVFSRLEKLSDDIKRTDLFINLINEHFSDLPPTWAERLRTSSHKEPPTPCWSDDYHDSINKFWLTYNDLTQVLSGMDPAQVEALIDQDAGMKRFAPLIHKLKNAPAIDQQKSEANDPKQLYEATKELGDSYQNWWHKLDELYRDDPAYIAAKEKREAEGNQRFANALTEIMKFRIREAQASGYEMPLDAFTHNNAAPHEVLEHFINATDTKFERILNEARQAEHLLDYKTNGKHYTWEEAKDIVISSYAAFDPELGAIAQKAFDEGWIRASKRDSVQPVTGQSVPPSALAAAHPFALVSFEGSFTDIMDLGHEMGHVLALHRASAHQSSLLQCADGMLGESYSQFGETLVADELLKRAQKPEEHLYIQASLLLYETHKLSLMAGLHFEEALYQRVKEHMLREQAGDTAPVSYDEINALYKQYIDVMASPEERKEVNVRGIDDRLISDTPYVLATYPLTKIMASALHDKWQEAPENFRKRYDEMASSGGAIDLKQFWETMIGPDTEHYKNHIDKRLDELSTQLSDVKEKLEKLPTVYSEGNCSEHPSNWVKGLKQSRDINLACDFGRT